MAIFGDVKRCLSQQKTTQRNAKRNRTKKHFAVGKRQNNRANQPNHQRSQHPKRVFVVRIVAVFLAQFVVNITNGEHNHQTR